MTGVEATAYALASFSSLGFDARVSRAGRGCGEERGRGRACVLMSFISPRAPRFLFQSFVCQHGRLQSEWACAKELLFNIFLFSGLQRCPLDRAPGGMPKNSPGYGRHSCVGITCSMSHKAEHVHRGLALSSEREGFVRFFFSLFASFFISSPSGLLFHIIAHT